jgi:hypothetical protein
LRWAFAVGEGFSKLSVLSGGPPFPYLICFSRWERVWELDVPLVVCPLRWFFLSSWAWVLPFLFLVFPLFWVLWFIFDLEGFII